MTGREAIRSRRDTGPAGMPALGPAEDEPTFGKSVNDAFSNPALTEWLAGKRAGEVNLLGAQTDHCVAAIATGAIAAGLKVTVVADAHSTWHYGGEADDAAPRDEWGGASRYFDRDPIHCYFARVPLYAAMISCTGHDQCLRHASPDPIGNALPDRGRASR